MQELGYLFLTVAVELPIAMVCLRKEHRKDVVLAVTGVNMITHPIIWWLLFEYRVHWFAGEIGVIMFEAMMFAVVFPKHRTTAMIAAIVMNIVTASIGYII